MTKKEFDLQYQALTNLMNDTDCAFVMTFTTKREVNYHRNTLIN